MQLTPESEMYEVFPEVRTTINELMDILKDTDGEIRDSGKYVIKANVATH